MKPDKRRRELVTPEGVALPLTVASRGARAGALLLDLAILFGSLILLVVALVSVGLEVLDSEDIGSSPALEFVVVLLIVVLFFARFGYFLWFELGPRGATPGKRAVGIRIAARGGGRLTAEAVIARNLVRDVEVWIPAVFAVSGGAGLGGAVGWAAGGWLAVFVLFPFFNRDALRAGDLVAGTWVVEAERRKLLPAMSVATPSTSEYRFGEAELGVYGEHELQVLEAVLRQGSPEAERQVMEAICGKLGWEAGRGDERAFLEAFYTALRARLERNMRFGRRKKDKLS